MVENPVDKVSQLEQTKMAEAEDYKTITAREVCKDLAQDMSMNLITVFSF